MDARRGFVPQDEKNFSKDGIVVMRKASKDLLYLLDAGYAMEQAVTFVGNHYLLSARQRLALARSTASSCNIVARKEKCLPLSALSNQTVWIDGFNQIITLEVFFSHSILLKCMDGTVRDLASLRGSYHLIPETDQAVALLLQVLQKSGCRNAVLLLDSPISNSGRLKTRIAQINEQYHIPLDIEIIPHVDQTFYEKKLVCTSDSIILDRCTSWFNLISFCAAETNADLIQVY